MKCARRLDNATKSYELMENPILFPLGIFPAPVRYIVESLQKYEHYQVDFTAVSFFTAFAAAMGNTWSARFMTGWVSRPILYVVLVGPPSCGKTPPLRQAVAPLLKLDEDSDRIYAQEIRRYRKWEKLTAKQRKQQSLPERNGIAAAKVSRGGQLHHRGSCVRFARQSPWRTHLQ